MCSQLFETLIYIFYKFIKLNTIEIVRDSENNCINSLVGGSELILIIDISTVRLKRHTNAIITSLVGIPSKRYSGAT